MSWVGWVEVELVIGLLLGEGCLWTKRKAGQSLGVAALIIIWIAWPLVVLSLIGKRS